MLSTFPGQVHTGILTDWTMEGFNLYAVYLSRRFLSAKIRVFIDHLVEMAG